MVRFCHLLKEVMEEMIMLWVPAHSLVQLKRVNKSWFFFISALINDPSFVAQHLLITKNKSSPSILFKGPSPCVDHLLVTFSLLTVFNDDDNNDSFISVTEAVTVPRRDNKKWHWDNWERVHHCDGILCLVKSDGTIMLCNPALQEFRILPESKNTPTREHPCLTGFEYDSRANDYKFVAIWSLRGLDVKFELYTLGSDSWREMNMSEDLSDYEEEMDQDGVCLKGIYYWLLHTTDESEEGVVLCFNMCNEEFHLIQFPDLEDPAPYECMRSLFVWKDSVTLCLKDKHEMYHFFVMDGDAKGVCYWTKRLRFRKPVNFQMEYLFWKNDEFLFTVLKDNEYQLVSYNLHTQEYRDIVVREPNGIGSYCWAWFCVKSLFSVRRR